MKAIVFLSVLLTCGARVCMAGPAEDFAKKVKAAHASGSLEAMMALYDPEMPDDLRFMYMRKVQRVLKEIELTEVEIVPYRKERLKAANGELKIRGTVYVFKPPITEQVFFRHKRGAVGQAVILIKGQYYLAAMKPK